MKDHVSDVLFFLAIQIESAGSRFHVKLKVIKVIFFLERLVSRQMSTG